MKITNRLTKEPNRLEAVKLILTDQTGMDLDNKEYPAVELQLFDNYKTSE